jgi:hypothetical protein
MSSNLPVRDLLVPPPDEPVLCFALDLFPRRGIVPPSLDLMVSRLMDFCLSAQSGKDLEITRMCHKAQAGSAALMVAHLVYDGRNEMVGQKMFDFSEDAIAARWQSGREAMARMLAALPPMPASGYVEVQVT